MSSGFFFGGRMTARVHENVSVTRCPACGQRIESPGARCPLCGFSFRQTGDERITGGDVTPYAKAFSAGQPGWWAMCRWVWLASSERLKHLALMRASAASRAFALRTALFLTLGLSLFQGSHVGWNPVRGSGDLKTPAAMKPAGRGWIHLAGVPRPLPPEFHADAVVDLWWNPAQAMIGGVMAGVSGLLLLWLLRHALGAGIDLAHHRPFQGEQRMSAALLYSSAWAAPALLGMLACLLRPIAVVGQVARWSWSPAERTLTMLAGAIVALSAIFWWIWLVRLGATAPPVTRTRVMGFFLLGTPLIAVGAAAGWWYGLQWTFVRLFLGMGLHP